MKLDDITEGNDKKKGTYAGVRFNEETLQAIKSYMADNDIPKPLNAGDIHSTLLYSRKFLPEYKPNGTLEKPWEGEAKHFSIFKSNPKNGGDGSNCLVLEYTCKEQTDRFTELMDMHDATYDFDEYKPHITLSYDVGDLEYKKLPKFDAKLMIIKEYGEDLDLDWAEKT